MSPDLSTPDGYWSDETEGFPDEWEDYDPDSESEAQFWQTVMGGDDE